MAPPGTFPTNSYQASNYFRDIVFVPNASGLASVSVSPASVTGGSSLTGTVNLNGAAPGGGAVVSLSATNPLAQPHTIQSVNYSGALQADGSISWASLGPPYFNSVPSGTVATVSGVPGLTATLTNSANQPLQFDFECPADNCAWVGNFNPGASVLWDGGTYVNGNWVGNGPLTLAFSSPQRGLGFQIMADEFGPFTATLCAFDSSNRQLGCASFNGNSSDPLAKFVGIYDDTQEISKVTIDAGGALYPHDFAISDALVVSGQKQLVTLPATVTVPGGSITATFPVTTNQVSTTTPLTISGSYNAIQSATLTLTAPVLSSIVMNANSVPGGTSSTGTVTLASPAPSGGAVVVLTNDVPVAQAHTIQAVTYPTSLQANGSIVPSSLQADGSISWSTLGPTYFTTIASGTVLPVSGLPGLNVTLTNTANLPLQYLTECPGFNCGWVGNFNPGADILWDGGQDVNGTWVGNGPMTVAFSSPQRGLGFQIMADELGPFTATMCAYNSSNTQLGCASFSGVGSEFNQAIPIGLYDDTQEISKVVIDAGGALYPHDFGIGDLFVTNAARPVVAVVPSSVTVPAGQTTGTFTVTTNPINTSTFVTITGSYSGTQAVGALQVTSISPSISTVSFAPASVAGGNSTTGTVTLASPAITGGAVVALSSDNAAAKVPATVTVAARATTANFTVNTTAVASTTSPTITATLNGTTATAQLTVNH
jgi:trimeric autotransporter adhesin